jgi:hypothetical protein
MLKKILAGFAALLVASIGGFYALWSNNANNTKKEIEQIVTNLNGLNSTVTYDTLIASGFPFELNISIVRPHIMGHIDRLISKDFIENGLHKQALPDWSEDFTLNGNIVLSANLFSNKYKMLVQGNWDGKSSIAGKPVAVSSESIGDSMCELQLQRTPAEMLENLWNFKPFTEAKMDASSGFMENFRSFECTNLGGKLIDSTSKEVIASNSGSNLLIARTPSQDGLSNIHFYVKIVDSEVTKAGDAFFANYTQAFNSNAQPLPLSLSGKQNMEIDISYNGADDWKNPEAKNLPLDVQISKFIFSSDAGQGNISFHLSNDKKDAVRNASISYKSEVTATDVMRKITAENIANTFRTTTVKPEELATIAFSVTPDFTSLGKIVAAIDAKYTGDDNFNGEATLSSFELSTTPYGLTANGSAKKLAESPAPNGNLSISCNNCIALIDDGAAYAKRVQSAIATFEPQTAAFIDVSPESVQKFKDFLLAISTPTDGNLKFDIVSTGTAEPTVNGKNISEIMALFSQQVAMPASPTPASSAPESAAPVVPVATTATTPPATPVTK